MIYSKTPLRISLFGGGTDNPLFFNNHKGTVTGFTINQFTWIFGSSVKVDQGFKFRLGYRTNEDVTSLKNIKHPIFRVVLKDYPNLGKFHFTTMSNLPSGAGLGSSSSFTVGLVALLKGLNGLPINKDLVANEAIRYEREVLQEAGGWQDQLHAAFGGINTFDFESNTGWRRKPLNISKKNFELLSSSMLILYTGILRSSNNVEHKKSKDSKNSFLVTKKTYDLAMDGNEILKCKSLNLSDLGRNLNLGWELKKKLSVDVSNNQIDETYDKILRCGAYGAKLCGAGGGGFFFVLANQTAFSKLKKEFGKEKIVKVSIWNTGVQIGQL